MRVVANGLSSTRRPLVAAALLLAAALGGWTVGPTGGAVSLQAPLAAVASQPERQDEFVPVDELPASEQLPAARFLVAAYVVAWVVILVYVWSVWKRITRVERDLAALERLQQTRRPSLP